LNGRELDGFVPAEFERNVPRLTADEHEALSAVHDVIAEAIRRAQKVPSSIDRRCMALVVTKLEEAEHWALQARRLAADRKASG
jgi:hypothetical protein